MIILLHIAIALTSIIVSGVALVHTSRRVLGVSYGLVAATLVSGIYLVFSAPAHLPSACASGLLYLAAVGTLTVVAQRKLAAQTDR